MMIHEITEQVGKHKARKRIGRGRGSGVGKTSGKGHKGAQSRAGFKYRADYEGGQMSLVRRMPKRGFSNANFRNAFHVVNLKSLESRVDDGADVSLKTLVAMRIVRDDTLPLKILGEGDLTKKFNVTAAKFSAAAKQKIEAAGGTATEQPFRSKWIREPGPKKPKAGVKTTKKNQKSDS